MHENYRIYAWVVKNNTKPGARFSKRLKKILRRFWEELRKILRSFENRAPGLQLLTTSSGPFRIL